MRARRIAIDDRFNVTGIATLGCSKAYRQLYTGNGEDYQRESEEIAGCLVPLHHKGVKFAARPRQARSTARKDSWNARTMWWPLSTQDGVETNRLGAVVVVVRLLMLRTTGLTSP